MVWDEANIELCEAGKDAQMKIDEPKTPYNFLLMSRSESEDEGEGEGENAHSDAATRVPPPQSLDEALKRLTSEEEDADGEALTEEERERKHAEFEEHRRKHYNEFLAVKRYREEKLRKLRSEGHADDADADDADDVDDADEEEKDTGKQ